MKNYGVLKAKAKDYKRDEDDDPHSELLLVAAGANYRIAVNVRSSKGPKSQRLIEYVMEHNFSHPALDAARALDEGWTNLADGRNDQAALDYVRSNLFRAEELKPITHTAPGPGNDLFEFVEDLVQRAIDDESAVVYAFGERWGPEGGKADEYFDFKPGNGVHKIHMNQGDNLEPNTTYEDGALIVDFPNSASATALFLKFQSQHWHTDEQSGAPLDDAPAPESVPVSESGELKPWNVLPGNSPYSLARIVSAMVNPKGKEAGAETVTILNISKDVLDLSGWSILDTNDRASAISGTVSPGQAITVTLDDRGAVLGNAGGTITLLNAAGLKVDGVAYTKADAKKEGRPVSFV